MKEIQVRNTLVVSCMRRAGFASFDGDGLQPAQAPDNATALPAGAWGYLGPEVAAVQGFHPPRRTAPGQPAPPPGASSEAFDAARVDCDRQAAERLGSPPSTGTELIGRLFDDSLRATGRDSRVVAATRAWSDCMAAAGFQAPDPAALPERFRAGQEITPAELATARADAECTTGSNLAGIWFAVLAGYQRQQIDHNAQALNAQREAVRAQDAKLSQLLAGDGS
ncbi:hypothetical protein ACFVVX_35880 [Kitasatospora sp. NPDC058170]|uniref:hypothetical protein n=1 Tax=Kitasatospora sp. NPDC058170 TaxID=3346364 RepID=UPI0036D9BEC1